MRTVGLYSLRFLCSTKPSRLRNASDVRCRARWNSTASPVRVWAQTKSGSVEVTFTPGRPTMTISTGQLARFADGSAVVQLGETTVMVTTVGKSLPPGSNNSFVPLVVDYRQKAAAAGRIPTNFLRKELGPSEREVLTSRMIDRSLRPLFRTGEICDTQIMCNLLAVDAKNDPDIAAMNGASAALFLSDIPWDGPIGAVRVGLVDSELIINPTRKELQGSSLNLVIAAADDDRVVMVDASASNISQQDFMKAVTFGTTEAQKVIAGLRRLQKLVGKPKREPLPAKVYQPRTPLAKSAPEIGVLDEVTVLPAEPTSIETVQARCAELAADQIRGIFTDPKFDKIGRDVAVTALRTATTDALKKEFPDFDSSKVGDIFSVLSKETFRNLIFDTNVRCDGRSLDDLRYIRCKTNIFKPLHGSALFERGQTQVLCTVTFDSLDSAWKADPASVIISGLKEKNFMLHYEFPPYATNETGRMSAFGRRELGHGALAEKALRAVIPSDFPFTIRLTSEVLESNGSSSMATICGGSLALMDAGVPISEPAAGVAVGLVTKYDATGKEITDYRILTDLLGIEDYLGDMDFKLAGTRHGITALQVDVKIPGLPLNIVMEAIEKGGDGRNRILDIMRDCLPAPREAKKDNAPVVEKLDIPPQKRSKFVGFGGYNLKKITASTGVQITQTDDAVYNLFAPNQAALDEAKQLITEILEEDSEPELQFGAVYSAKVAEVREGGIMVTLHSRQTPFFIPNSQLDSRKVGHANVLGFEVGHDVSVKYFGRDPATGRHRASRKVLVSIPSSAVKALS
ncbi:Polyribonucleotide nucleotidyltransferase 1, mitochondrial [Hypsibius exemplaris]|uniref:polyribonucleotide nucleotidyltransferase n=1 Tax=Hypsibius exemplaris TaxID=2072580 RepID=A0A1W0WSH7_HYPEX|nr:Polyribonucleotide nucleotidyltransferase 1, mitochondrial [Hypsibius exemplaris]